MKISKWSKTLLVLATAAGSLASFTLPASAWGWGSTNNYGAFNSSLYGYGYNNNLNAYGMPASYGLRDATATNLNWGGAYRSRFDRFGCGLDEPYEFYVH